MKRVVMLLAVLFILLLLCLSGCSQDVAPESEDNSQGENSQDEVSEEVVVLKLGHVVQEGHSWDLTVKEFARLIEERTNGRYVIEIYPARQLGNDLDMLESIMAGSLDMGAISASVFENYTPLITGLQLPWLFDDLDELYAVYNSDIHKKLVDGVSDIGVKAFAIYDCGFRHFCNNIGPINTPDDMKGMSFRSVESPLVIGMYSALGAVPTPTPYGEIYTSVQTNVVNGLDIGFKAGCDEHFFEVAPYISVSNHFTFPVVLIMNPAIFENMSAEDQAIFEQTAMDCVDFNYDVVVKECELGEQEAIDMGAKINIIEDTAPFRELMQPIYDEYMEKDPLIKELVEYVDSL